MKTERKGPSSTSQEGRLLKKSTLVTQPDLRFLDSKTMRKHTSAVEATQPVSLLRQPELTKTGSFLPGVQGDFSLQRMILLDTWISL